MMEIRHKISFAISRKYIFYKNYTRGPNTQLGKTITILIQVFRD